MKPSLAAYSTEHCAAVGAYVLPEPNDAEKTGVTVRGGGQNSPLGGSEAGGGETGSQYHWGSVHAQRA